MKSQSSFRIAVKPLLLVASVMLLYVITANAQDSNVRIVGQCDSTAGSGFVNPVCSASAEGSLRINRTVLNGGARYSFARKRPGGGHGIGGELSVRIPVRSFFVGPAVAYTRQTTSFYTKDAFSVGGEVGKRFDRLIISGRFLQDVTSENKMRSYTFTAEWHGPKHLYLRGVVGGSDFKCFQTQHCTGFRGGVGIGVYFK